MTNVTVRPYGDDLEKFHYSVSDYPRLIQHRRFVHKLTMEGYLADVEVLYDMRRDKVIKEHYVLRRREEKVDDEGNNYATITKLGEYSTAEELLGVCRLLVEDEE